MNKHLRGLTALVVALCLLWTAFPAIAAAPEDTWQIDLAARINPRVYSLSDELVPYEVPTAVQPVLIALISHLNKFYTTLLVGNQALSGVIGTQRGEVADFQAVFDEEEGLKGLTSNLLPGLLLTTDPQWFAAVKKQLSMETRDAIDPQEALASLARYGAYVQEQISQWVASAPAREGEYKGLFGGDYTKAVTVTITTAMVGDVLAGLARLLEEDPLADRLFPGVAQELSRNAADAKAVDPWPMAVLTVYQRTDGTRLYDIRDTSQVYNQSFKLDLLIKECLQQPEQTKLHAQWQLALPYPPLDALVDEEVTQADWDRAIADIRSGASTAGTLLEGAVDMEADDDQASQNLQLGVYLDGENISLRYTGQQNLAARTTQGRLDVFFRLEEPLLSLDIGVQPADRPPSALSQQGLKQVALGDALTPQDAGLLESSLQKGWSALMERLAIALD